MFNANKQGELNWSFARGSDLAKIFDTAIKYNKGFYKITPISELVNIMLSVHGACFSCEVSETNLEELDLSPLKHQHMFIIGGRYQLSRNEKAIPICYVYIVDNLGPVEKYKCKFTCKNNRKRLCDYELMNIELVWQRTDSKDKKCLQ